MRIRQLELKAFGHFTDVSIPLNPRDTGIDFIYGPNEAGKSTTLRAVQALLFGFPPQTNDNFRHEYTSLRVGATFAFSDGSQVAVMRRKGNVKTLRDAADQDVIDDSVLTRVLGSLESASFRSRFALDCDELVRGGRAIVSGEGDLAQALFAAASGGRQLDTLRRTLDTKAGDLFKAGARAGKSSPKINQQLKEIADLEKRIRDVSLAPDDWQAARDDLDQLEQRRDAVSSGLAALNADIRRLERFRDALPLLARRRDLAEELRELSDVPQLRDDFTQRRHAAVSKRDSLTAQIEQAEAQLRDRQETLGTLAVSDSLLSHATTIRELRNDLGSIRELRLARGERLSRIERLRAAAADSLRELRWTGSDELPATLRPSASAKRRLDQLRDDFLKLQSDQRHLETAETEHRSALQLAQQRLDELPDVENDPALRQAVELARQAGPLDTQLSEAQADVRRLQKRLDQDLASLGLWTGTADDLERAALPLTETLDRFALQFESLDGTQSKQRDDLKRCGREITAAETKLRHLTAERDVPTEQSLIEARAKRDQLWLLVSQRLSAASEPATPAADDSNDVSSQELAAAYEQALRQADELSDRLRNEAQLVAEAATLRGLILEQKQHRSNIEADLTESSQQRETLDADWHRCWTALSIEPLPPREMKEWCRLAASLFERNDELRSETARVTQFEERISQHVRRLGNALSRETPNATELAPLLQQAEDELTTRSAAQASREQAAGRVDTELAAGGKLALKRESLARELADWKQQWQSVAAETGSSTDATPDEAIERRQHLEAWFTTQDELDQLATEDRRAVERCEDFDGWARDLLARLSDVAADLPGSTDPAVAIEELDSRRELNDRLAIQRDELRGDVQRRADDLAALQHELDATQAALRLLCQEAHAESIDVLPEIEDRAAARRRARERFEQVTESLDQLTGGRPIDEFAAEAAAFTIEQLDADLPDLIERRDRHHAERDDVITQIGDRSRQLANWTGESQAVQAREELETVLASVRRDAEQFARLTIVSDVLRRAGDRYREQHQGPVIRRASELFCDLTCGAFAGLQTDYDDKGNPVIVGLRSSSPSRLSPASSASPATAPAPQPSTLVPVSGMSEGTCDQLYLALRLASLEEYLDHHEPVPLLIDDLLIRFDDARSSAALQVLATLSERTQIIVFTHHDHILTLAARTLDPSRLHIHRLK